MTDARFREINLNDFSFSGLNTVLDYWQSVAETAHGALPSWKAIDLTQISHKTLPQVCVVDVNHAGPEFRYRFWGTAITSMHHYDLTGRSIMDLTPKHYATCIWEQYKRVLDSRAPAAFMTEVPLGDFRFTYYAAVRLPLSGDGEIVDHILTAEEYGDEKNQLRKLFKTIWNEND